jgi:uncharacterized protein YukE
MITSATLTSTWAVYSIGAGVAALVVIAALAEADPDEDALTDAATKWREANAKIKELADKFTSEAKPPIDSWNGTKDRAAFDAVIDKVNAEIASIVKVFENNATALEEAKKFYNKALPLILGMIVTATGIIVALMAVKATLFGAPIAEGAQSAVAWGAAAAVVGAIGSLVALLVGFITYNEGSARVSFQTEAAKGELGADVDFQKIAIDWGTSKKGAKPR